MSGGRTLDDAALDQLFRTARSRNGWREETLPDDTWRELYDLLKWGPTSANTSPGRFVFVTSPEGVAYDPEFTPHVPRLFPHHPGAASWFGDHAEHPGRVAAATLNATLQGAYLIPAVRALGLDCGPMLGFDREGIDREVLAGFGWRTSFLVALGHGADEAFPRSPRLDFDDAARIV